MARGAALAAGLAALVLALAASPALAAPTVTDLTATPFNTVALCGPYNVLISPGPKYSVTIDAEDAVKPFITATVTGKTLQTGTTGSFTTQKPIAVTVTLPANALAEVDVGGLSPFSPQPGAANNNNNDGGSGGQTTGLHVITPGFTAPLFKIGAVGTVGLWVQGLTAPTLYVLNSGTANVAVNGTLGETSLQASGTGNNLIYGATGAVHLRMSGITNTYISAASPTVKIDGQSSGISSVQYNQGACSGSFTCQQGPIQPVTYNPQWTCGLQTAGPISCGNDGSVVTLPCKA